MAKIFVFLRAVLSSDRLIGLGCLDIFMLVLCNRAFLMTGLSVFNADRLMLYLIVICILSYAGFILATTVDVHLLQAATQPGDEFGYKVMWE